MTKKRNLSKQDHFLEITKKIVSYIEENDDLPWRSKAWQPSIFPVRFNGESYNGLNFINLAFTAMMKGYASNRWLTWNQASKLGARVKSSEAKKYQRVCYFNFVDVNKDGNGDEKIVPFVKWSCVYNVDQVESLPSEFYDTERINDNKVIDTAQSFVDRLPGTVKHKDGCPMYVPSIDTIFIPRIERFDSSVDYYKTLSHEYVHWTGHSSRLDRLKDVFDDKKGRAFEELIAELGAAFLLPEFDLKPLIDSDHAPYLKSWLKAFKNDSKYLYQAASKAEKAVKLLKDLSHSDSQSNFKEALAG